MIATSPVCTVVFETSSFVFTIHCRMTVWLSFVTCLLSTFCLFLILQQAKKRVLERQCIVIAIIIMP